MSILSIKSKSEPDNRFAALQEQAKRFGKVFSQLSADIKPTWTVAAMRSALLRHERGDFEQSAKLVDTMARDDRLPSVLDLRVRGLIGARFDLQPATMHSEAEQEKANEVSAVIESRWHEMFPEDALIELLQWRHMMGFALAQLVWVREAGFWLPTLDVWHPSYVWFEEDANRWHVNAREGDIIIDPADPTWVLIGSGQRPYMTGKVRSLADPWMSRRFTWRDWSRYNEVHGMPIRLAMVPAVADDSDQAAFANDLRVLATETTITLPQNLDEQGSSFGAELLEASDQAHETFKNLLDQTADTFAVRLLGNNLVSEVRGGSFAAALQGGSTFVMLLSGDGHELSTQLRKQALTWVAELNYGDRALAPHPTWHTEPEKDVKARADAMTAAAGAITAMAAANVPLDLQSVAEDFNIPIDPAAENINASAALFRYHLDFGILTINEARARLGLGPVADGDQRASLSAQPAAPIEDPLSGRAPTPPPTEATMSKHDAVRLASGDPPSAAPGMVSGQIYTDDVADAGIKEAQKAMQPDLDEVMRIIDTSTGFGDLRARLREAFADMNPDAHARLLEAALTMTELAGRMSVDDDAPKSKDDES